MKKHIFIIIALLTAVLFVALSFRDSPEKGDRQYLIQQGELLVPQNNVVVALVDLESASRSLRVVDDIVLMRRLHDEFSALDNVVKVESLLSAYRVISTEDDILVTRAIPDNDNELDAGYLASLLDELDQFPELRPFVSDNRQIAVYYIYYANRTPPGGIYQQLTKLQDKWKDTLAFDFTGRSPVVAATERFLTGDMELTFPLLAVIVLAVMMVFGSLRVILTAFVLIITSMAWSYGFVHFLGLPDTPLVLLIPVFGLGLLVDYLIHYYYHYLYSDFSVDGKQVGKQLLFPLSLTALSTITGFLSLCLINGSGHTQLGLIISLSVMIVWAGVFFWLSYQGGRKKNRALFPGFQTFQAKLFMRMLKYRYVFFVLTALAVVWGAFQLQNLVIEPYPVKQLPAGNTIRLADKVLNEELYGTLPFFLEIDTGKKNGILEKKTIAQLQKIHDQLDKSPAGYSFSILSVLKRMHYYFTGSEETLLHDPQYNDSYDALIEQYLLYFSSSVDPLEYESLLDSSYRIFSVKGFVRYDNYRDLETFAAVLKTIQKDFPEGWTLNYYGMSELLENEHRNLRNNWILSFATGSILIFFTVLLFYKKLYLALISLLPGAISMIISFGLINLAGISVDVFSIIFVSIITGLVVDYSIHVLSAVDRLSDLENLEQAFHEVVGYSGLPVFLSFLTSLVSGFVLLFSSFNGARNLGFILIVSLILAFFLSLYLLPLILLPLKSKGKEL